MEEEAETGGIQLHARDTKDGQRPAETGRKAGNSVSLRPPEGTSPAGTAGPGFRPPQPPEN